MPGSRGLRRSPSLVLYWERGRLVAHNFITGKRLSVDPDIVPFLTRGHFGDLPPNIADHLTRLSLLERASGETSDEPVWPAWGPLASAFHFGTKDLDFETDVTKSERRVARLARRVPMPPPVKRAPRKAARLSLPRSRAGGEFADTLVARRTWRDFGRNRVEVLDVATLLQLTWGVQRHARAPGQGPVVLKTSPSAGACHPVEVYLLAVRVDGLAPGLYHYESDAHTLAVLRRGASRNDIGRYLPAQPWYRPAAALFLMTGVFERTQWRYATPRAYRAVLLDAGHLCQTFCLTATWLKLAPFCSMALADSVIERDLGLDGVSEGVLYAAGVGLRPSSGWRPGLPGYKTR